MPVHVHVHCNVDWNRFAIRFAIHCIISFHFLRCPPRSMACAIHHDYVIVPKRWNGCEDDGRGHGAVDASRHRFVLQVNAMSRPADRSHCVRLLASNLDTSTTFCVLQ